jgi:hypothetical protein
MLVDEPQAFALSRREEPGRIVHDVRSCAHCLDT